MIDWIFQHVISIALTLAGIALGPALSLAQEEGYNYEPPDNPLVLTRPSPAPERRPEPQPVQVDQGRKAEPQDGGGGGDHHHDSDDPLAWLRDSVPGL